MIPKHLADPAVGIAVSLVVITASTWGWQARIFRSRQTEVKTEAWDQVKDQYPISPERQAAPTFTAEMSSAVERASPFSSTRHFVQPPSGGGGGEGGSGGGATLPPKFVYKGQISMGKRQRGILEDTATQKTHFLEVGQEVAGFKVLDISQNQMVLWDSQTQQQVVVSLASPQAGGEEEQAPSDTQEKGHTTRP